MDTSIVNEWGVEVQRRVVFEWEPVLYLQTRLSCMLPYSVKIYYNEEEQHPCQSISAPIVIIKEHYTTPLWYKLLNIPIDIPYSVKVVNASANITVEHDTNNPGNFTVNTIESEEYGWTVTIPDNRLDVIDTITGNINREERLYINIVTDEFDESIIQEIGDYMIDSLLYQHFYIIICVSDSDDNHIYSKII
jgi:hypothetical protein